MKVNNKLNQSTHLTANKHIKHEKKVVFPDLGELRPDQARKG